MRMFSDIILSVMFFLLLLLTDFKDFFFYFGLTCHGKIYKEIFEYI